MNSKSQQKAKGWKFSSNADSKMFKWSPKDETLSELVKKETFPTVFLVTSGHEGEAEWESLGNQQVIWAHRVGSWKRVIARDSKGRGYSIPVTYPVPFRKLPTSIGKSGGKPLQKILDGAQYPVKIQVCSQAKVKFSTAKDPRCSVDLGPLVINGPQDIYDERFIKGNGISQDGRLQEIIVFPCYINIRVSVAENVAMYKELEERAHRMNYDRAVPHMNIKQYSQKKVKSTDQPIYENLEPDEYISYTSLKEVTDDHLYTGFNEQTDKCPEHLKPPLSSENMKQRKHQPLPKPPPPPPPSKSTTFRSDPGGPVNIYSTPPECKWIRSFDEVPVHIGLLSVEEVSDCLQLLRMSKYVSHFRDNLIDGEMLMHLERPMMERELGMNSLDAAKLHRFVHDGWRPALGGPQHQQRRK